MKAIPFRVLFLFLTGWLFAFGSGIGHAAGQDNLPGFRLVQVGALPDDARYVTVQDARIYFVSQGRPGENDRLLVAAGDDPRAPTLLGAFETARGLHAVAIDGPYAYLANGYQGLMVVRIAKPDQMQEVARAHEVPYAVDVVVAKGMAYVAAGDGALHIFDVTEPTQPSWLGVSTIQDYEGKALAVAGDYAYIASGGRGMRVVDISNPNQPVSVGFYDPPGPELTQDVVVAGDRAYLAQKNIRDLTGRLVVLDITNPRIPLEIADHSVVRPALGVAFADGRVFLAQSDGGLAAFDVTLPGLPIRLAEYNTSGQAIHVAVGMEGILLADAEGGLRIFHFLQPTNYLPYIFPSPAQLDEPEPPLLK